MRVVCVHLFEAHIHLVDLLCLPCTGLLGPCTFAQVSDTLESFTEEQEQADANDEGDLVMALNDGTEKLPMAVGGADAGKPKNPLSMNPYDECDGYKMQLGQPAEAKLLLHGHHHERAFHTVNDAAMREAVGKDVTFIFSREVDGCDLSKFE